MNTKLRKMKNNAKALSPVVASIILIAVTVAVSVVVAAWMGGMSLGLMGNAEQAAITNIAFSNQATKPGELTATIQNTGSAAVTISSATIDGVTATVTGVPVSIPKGGSTDVVITGGTATTPQFPTGFADTASYQIKLMTAKGNTIVYTASYAGP